MSTFIKDYVYLNIELLEFIELLKIFSYMLITTCKFPCA